MKAAIHPKYNENCVVTCACGNTFTTGSTLEKIEVEVCSKCHPFFTGQQKFVDIKGKIDKFKDKVAKGKAHKAVVAERQAKKAVAKKEK